MNFLTERHKYPSICQYDDVNNAFVFTCRDGDFKMARKIAQLWPRVLHHSNMNLCFIFACDRVNIEFVNWLLQVWPDNFRKNKSFILIRLGENEKFFDIAKNFYSMHKHYFGDVVIENLLMRFCNDQKPIIYIEWLVSLCDRENINSILNQIYNYKSHFKSDEFAQLIVFIIDTFGLDDLQLDRHHQQHFDQILHDYKFSNTKSSRTIL